MTAFVVDLVQHQTAEDTHAVAYESFVSLPDPDNDSRDLDAYSSLF